MHSTLNSKTLDLCFLQTNYECAHRRFKVEHFKKQFLWKQFFFHPNLIMRVELVWGANWKTMENLTVFCLDLFDEENSSIDWSPYFPSGAQFKCPPGHTFAPRKASPKSSSPICGQVVAPSPPLLASPMASRLHLQTVNRYHNQLCQHRHHCNHQT